MKKENKFLTLLSLFFTFMKIGALTFGGGLAMIPIMQREAVDKKKWVSEKDIFDMIAIAESTPGPHAVNTATYVGFEVMGIWGSFFATLGLAIPSFVIIFVISFFYQEFMNWHFITAIFKGLKAGVIILLINAFLKLKKGVDKTPISFILFTLVICTYLIFNIFKISFPFLSLCFIFSGLMIGVITELLERRKE